MFRFQRFIATGVVGFSVLLSAFLGASSSVLAAQPQAIATYRDWSVFVRGVDGDKICFAAAQAKDKSPKSVRHGDVFFLIASWQSGAATHQPSLMTGYNMKDKPSPVVRVGADKWSMYVSDNEAFIENDGAERKLINAMRRGADMRVSAVSSRGTATNYTISLRGVTKALERAEAACR
ncbi:MAG: invasion associated locus B family protein [Pseudomonadota bacterium]